jgi:hypothetical protein
MVNVNARISVFVYFHKVLGNYISNATLTTAHECLHIQNSETNDNTVIPRFTSLIRSSKTSRKAKTHVTKINFPLLPDGDNYRFARGRSSYKWKLARKLKNSY